jgi:hypothetical protein
VGTYPCSTCGATADTATGCPSCGAPIEAELATLDRTISSMQRRSRAMVDERGALMARLQGAIAIRTMLQRSAEAGRGGRSIRRGRGVHSGPADPAVASGAGRIPPAARAATATARPDAEASRAAGTTTATSPRTSAGGRPPGPAAESRAPSSRTATATRTGAGGAPPRVPPRQGPPTGASAPRAPSAAGATAHHPHPPETTVRSVQNLVLGLGAAVMAVAVALTPFIYTSLAGELRALILAVLTVVALLLPIAFARRGLITTAEWVAPLGMLLILLDAQEAWVGGLHRFGLRATVYAGVVALIAAGFAFGSHELSKLAMLRFTSIVLVQPVLPLLLYPWLRNTASWASVLAAVAAIDLVIAMRTHRRYPHGPYLRTAVRSLQEAVAAAAVVAAAIALARATSADASVRAGAALVTAAVVGLAAGLLFRHWPMCEIWAGVATAAAVAGFGRIGAMTLPGWGLIVTSVALVATAFLVRLLPGYARRGAQIAGAIATGLTALVIVIRGWGAFAGPLAATMPAWNADIGRYAATVASHLHHHSGQLPVATLLTMIAAMVMAPLPWRRMSLVGGVTLAAVLAPGAWQLPWATGIAAAAIPALAIGVLNLTAATERESWTGVIAALVTGGYAAAIAAGRPGGQAVLLLAFTIAGAVIGLAVFDPPRLRPRDGRADGTPSVAPKPSAIGEPALVDTGAHDNVRSEGLVEFIGVGEDTVAVNPETTWLRTRPWMRAAGVVWTGVFDVRAADAGWGAAAFALPGGIAAATAALAPPGTVNVTAILAASFVTVAAVLTATAVSQVARRRNAPLTVAGATLAAFAVMLAAVRTSAAEPLDVGVALILLASALVLCIAPSLKGGMRLPRGLGGTRETLFGLDGDETAAAAVTAAAIVAVGRVASLAAPGLAIVVIAFLVLCVAAGTRAMPEQWRAGPAAGATIVGLGVAVGASVDAVRAGIAVFRVNQPVWHVVPAGWGGRVSAAAGDIGQAPQALLLLAAAAVIVLPRAYAKMGAAVTIGLAALAAPAALGTGLWGPVLFSGVVATVTGIVAARSVDRATSTVCGAVATVLFADTIGASLTSPASTAAALIGSTVVNVAVAFTASATLRRALAQAAAARRALVVRRALPGRTTVGPVRANTLPELPHTQPELAHTAPDKTNLVIANVDHLVIFGGGALAGGILTFTGAAGVFAAALHRPWTGVLVAALAGLSLSLALLATTAQRVAPLLAYATGAIAIGGLTIAIMAARVDFTTTGVFAAAGAILAVVAEMLRSAIVRPRPRRIVDVRRRVTWLPSQRRAAVLLAAGPATVLALASIAPTILAALVGPYRWIVPSMVWHGPPVPPDSLHELGSAASLVGHPSGLATAVLLTLAGVLAAVGFGGSRAVMVGRAVAVVVPAVAVTLLIAPYLENSPWPDGPVTAVSVATMCHLALALTRELPDNDAASALRAARQLVIAIAITSGAAGITGGLATPAATIGTVATATGAGIIAAIWGRIPVSRIAGWILASAGAQALALVICLHLAVQPYNAAFVVGGVAAALLVTAAVLPQLRRPEAVNETLTVEVSAYAGAVLALVLAAQSLRHVAVFLGAWGAVLGIAAARQRRSELYRSLLMWTASAHELVAWCLLMAVTSVAVPEAYTLGIAVVALVTGWIELRWHPQLTSWVTYGVALTAALGPSLAITIATGETPLRRTLLLVAAAAVTIFGAIRRQQAPVIIGGVTLLGETINEIARYSTTALILVLMAIIAAVLIGVGANYEKRRRNVQRVWTVFNRMQ